MASQTAFLSLTLTLITPICRLTGVGPLGDAASHFLGLDGFDGGGDIGSKEAVLPLGPAVEGTLDETAPGQTFLLSDTLLFEVCRISLTAGVLESIRLV